MGGHMKRTMRVLVGFLATGAMASSTAIGAPASKTQTSQRLMLASGLEGSLRSVAEHAAREMLKQNTVEEGERERLTGAMKAACSLKVLKPPR